MNFCQTRLRLVEAGAALAAVALVAGCGNNYRPVVTPVNPSGPPAQPQSWAVVVSAPSPTAAGIATIIDYSGDSIMAFAPIGPDPTAFTIDSVGASGYTIDSDHTITNFPITSSLQEKQITYTTLLSTADPLNLFSPSNGLWAADIFGNVADVFTGSPQTFLRSVPLASTTPAVNTPVMIMGSGTGGLRYYALSQNLVTATNPTPTGEECNTSPTTQPLGDVTGIEASTDTTDAPIQVGSCPVYAVQTSDGRRLFVLNRGSDTITVINAQNDTLDSCVCPPAGCVNQDNQTYTCHPTLPVSPANGLPHAGPVYAEYIIATSQLIVANYDGNSVSVIDVSLDEFGNDSSTFGTTYTIPVGNSPASVTALYDGSKAYTANQTDGTVTVVNLSSYSVEKTLAVVGHPRTVVSTQNSEYSKIYVASPDSSYLTIIESTPTINDLVDTTIPVEGNIVDVRTSTQNGSGGNANYVSRIPGYGQPCNLPLSEFNPATSANPAVALFDCQVQNVANLK